MLGVAERHLARERELLGHVGVNVLTALRDGGVKRPQPHIGDEDGDHRALAPRRVGKRVEQPVDNREAAAPGNPSWPTLNAPYPGLSPI